MYAHKMCVNAMPKTIMTVDDSVSIRQMVSFTPVIMLTTESQDAKKQEGKSAGARGWIVKPFKPEQLIAVIRKVPG